ncbi:hypothetical protein GPECTOR_1005g271 [Gonium pectorale]|uniref:Uncharacterized protein n=1 Tax=Gonium pectorale TaxID=33097 RepID=A0A150FTR0_GONPE|nr:hypothetical protein GPECTOR_1005g271 [Gonium pectorale]|eukprot:KXZ41003.1 hypothetical protein GPECTOR_1005g271 [Gonium pectorale]
MLASLDATKLKMEASFAEQKAQMEASMEQLKAELEAGMQKSLAVVSSNSCARLANATARPDEPLKPIKKEVGKEDGEIGTHSPLLPATRAAISTASIEDIDALADFYQVQLGDAKMPLSERRCELAAFMGCR